MRPCLTSARPGDSANEAAEISDEHHRLGDFRQLLPVADEAPVAGRQDAQGLLDAPAERDRDEARALPRARGDGEDRAVPGGIAGDVLAGVAAVADQPPQAPAGRVGAREQRIGAVLVVHAGGGHRRDEEEAGGARQDVALATVDPLAAVPTTLPLLGAAAHALAVDEAGPGLGVPAGGGARRGRQRAGGAVPHALAAEAVPPPAHRLPGREVLGQGPPAAALGDEVEAGLHDRPNGGAQRAVRREEGHSQCPFPVRQIARIALPGLMVDFTIGLRPHAHACEVILSSRENMGMLRSNRVSVGIIASACAMAGGNSTVPPLIIQEQGSFAVGGTVLRAPGTYNNNAPSAEGQSLHGDHLYAFYQIPPNPKALPIVMLHGAYQSARSWETTSHGREGFQTIFLRRGFPVYLVDQPRRGRAGNSTVAATIEPTAYDQLFFDQFRIGIWPSYFDGVQFDRKPETLNQFFRSVTPNTGPYDAGVISDAMSALFGRIGSAILFTHSQAGGPGWLTAIKDPNVKAIVAFEPGSGFVFPEGELPAAMPSAAGTLSPETVSLADFKKLTRIPIVIYYGDNIPTEPTESRGKDNWRVRLAMAGLWVDAVNTRGGSARL